MAEVSTRLSRRKKWLFATACLALVGFACFSLGELVTRLKGKTPFRPAGGKIQVEPGGRLYTNHPTLGFALLPGEFKITLPGPYAFKVTHSAQGRRTTHLPVPQAASKAEIWIFGCSFTHGWSLNDEETFPWLLQKALPEYEIVNFGVSGYSTLQSVVQFQEALKQQRPPAVAVLAYAGFHDERNTALRVWRKSIVTFNQLGYVVLPYARMNWAGQVKRFISPVTFWEFPLMRHSSLIHFLEVKYDRLEMRFCPSHAVSQTLIQEFANICQANGAKLVVAGINTDASSMLEFCQNRHIEATDIAVDLMAKENNNLPYDGHPSAEANRQYARKLEAFFRNSMWFQPASNTNVAKPSLSPQPEANRSN